MINPLIIPILAYLREQNSSCSLINLVNLCEEDLLLLIGKDVDYQVGIFQKNFFVMNALYQIQSDIQTEGFSLTILPLDIFIVANSDESTTALTKRDTDLASYYLDWSNLTSAAATACTSMTGGANFVDASGVVADGCKRHAVLWWTEGATPAQPQLRLCASQ